MFPKKRNGFVLDRQHGRRDVTCKPAIAVLTKICLALTLRHNKCNSFQYKPKEGGGGENIRGVQLSVPAGVPSSFRECDLKSLLRLTSVLCSLKYLRYRKME